jgi:hypothetical protein
MKITVTTIEASAEELRANRNLSDVLMDALSRACDAVARPVAEAEEVSMIREQMEGGDDHG